MKQLAKNLITAAMLGGALMSSAAAAQKIGVVHVQNIIAQMPQATTVQQTIADEFKDRQAELKQLEDDIKYQFNKRQREEATMSEAQIKELEDKIIKMRQEYAAKAPPLQQEVNRRLQEEQGKLLGLIQQAVESVAAEGKYDIILQRQAAAFLKEEHDLSDEVLEKVSKIK